MSCSRKPGSTNFLVWWDSDTLRELLDGNHVDKYGTSSDTRLLTADGTTSNNGTKSTPALSGDLLGDWREEVVLRTSSNNALRIYTTTNVASNRIYTLLHDPQYRVAIAWQNVGYNQPPHPSFYLGAGMSAPPAPAIYAVINGDFDGSGTVDAADLDVWRANAGQTTQFGQSVGDIADPRVLMHAISAAALAAINVAALIRTDRAVAANSAG